MITAAPKHALLINPSSGKGIKQDEIQQIYAFCKERLGDVQLFAPSQASGMSQITESLIDMACKSFIIVGGDGTINLIASRLVAAANTSTSICLIDSSEGGGDLSRSIWSTIDNQERLACLVEEQTQLIDTLAIEDVNGNTFMAINSCSVGISAAIARESRNLPRNWPRWAKYTVPTLRTLPRIKAFHTHKQGDAIAIVCSKGMFFGGGMKIAPEGKLGGGSFYVTTIRPGGIFALTANFLKLFSKGLMANKLVEKSVMSTIQIASKTTLHWEYDGECGETKALTIRCIPNTLRVVVPRSQIAV